jgi:hypothetical protein
MQPESSGRKVQKDLYNSLDPRVASIPKKQVRHPGYALFIFPLMQKLLNPNILCEIPALVYAAAAKEIIKKYE